MGVEVKSGRLYWSAVWKSPSCLVTMRTFTMILSAADPQVDVVIAIPHG